LHKAGFLHRDISINNILINENNNNASWPSFLIDLDLAIKEQREGVSGAKGKTGTRAFMAIGALLGEQHSFMHDLESFFWVLFWICIHYEGPGQERVVPRFDKWNFVKDMEELAGMKLGAAQHARHVRSARMCTLAWARFRFLRIRTIPYILCCRASKSPKYRYRV
jgi:serine/threonine protein kinase